MLQHISLNTTTLKKICDENYVAAKGISRSLTRREVYPALHSIWAKCKQTQYLKIADLLRCNHTQNDAVTKGAAV